MGENDVDRAMTYVLNINVNGKIIAVKTRLGEVSKLRHSTLNTIAVENSRTIKLIENEWCKNYKI